MVHPMAHVKNAKIRDIDDNNVNIRTQELAIKNTCINKTNKITFKERKTTSRQQHPSINVFSLDIFHP